MSWQDRDYARPTGRTAGPGWRGPYSSRLLGGSIVTTIIAINVALWVLGQLSRPLGNFIYGYGWLTATGVMHGQLWRLITAQYLHDPNGLGHIFFNMLVLHFLGRPLERMWSAKKFFWVYTVAGLVGNIFYVILGSQHWLDPNLPAIGASGCIYGLLGIVAVLFPYATVYIYFLFPMRLRTAAIIFGGIAVVMVITKGKNYGGEACHLAGLAFGVWWGLKGDRWWSGTEWRIPRARPQGSTRRPGAGSFQQQVQQRRVDAEEVDRILKKVHDVGIQSLSDTEKRILREATEREREREEGAPRVDRL